MSWDIKRDLVGALMGLGDVLAQTMIDEKKWSDVDWRRTAMFSSVGFVVVGPPLRLWYGFLDRQFLASSRLVAVKKTATDQLLFAPIFMGVVMGSIGLAQGNSLANVQSRLRQDYKDVLLANYKLWPLVQLCNFYLVPLQYQVLTVQVVAVFWNTYLSWKTNTELKQTGVSKDGASTYPSS